MRHTVKSPLRLAAIPAVALAVGLAACEQRTPTPPVPKTVTPAAPAAQPATVAPQPSRPPSASPQAAADRELAARVKEALARASGVNPHAIDVVAKDGAVTLFGTAETRARREAAGKAAADVAGVKSVDNKLAVVAGS